MRTRVFPPRRASSREVNRERREHEARFDRAIFGAFGLSLERFESVKDVIKAADRAALVIEADVVLAGGSRLMRSALENEAIAETRETLGPLLGPDPAAALFLRAHNGLVGKLERDVQAGPSSASGARTDAS